MVSPPKGLPEHSPARSHFGSPDTYIDDIRPLDDQIAQKVDHLFGHDSMHVTDSFGLGIVALASIA